jgi:putative peptidoglycan lipid II flippase
VIGSLILVIIAVGWLIMPVIIFLQAAGLKNSSPEDFTYAVSLARITLPFMFFISMMALFMGLMNANRNFVLPASNSLVLNILFIGVLLFFGSRVAHVYALGYQVAYAYIYGGFLIFFYQFFYIRKKYDFHYQLKFNPKGEGIRRIFKMMLPAIGSMAVVHLNIMVDTLLASFISPGTISVIRYAETIIQFPIGVIGVAVFNTALPSLSASVKKKETNRSAAVFRRLVHFILLIGVPVSVGLFAIRHDFVTFLYQYKNFSAADTLAVVNVLQFYIIGIIGFFGVRIVSTLFYASEEIHIPFKVGMAAMGLNIVLNLILMQFMGAAGLALASSIAALANISVLLIVVNKKYFPVEWKKCAETFVKAFVASGIMYAAVVFTGRFFTGIRFFERLAAVLGPVAAGVLIYFVALILLRPPGADNLFAVLKKRFRKKGFDDISRP